MTPRRRTPALLLICVLILAPLIPGGPIENRTFVDYPVWVIAAFNLYISTVVLAALPIAWRARHGGRGVVVAAALDAAGFTAIYALDLLGKFPVSETPMSPTLTAMAYAGLAAGIAAVASALLDLRATPPSCDSGVRLSRPVRRVLGGLALAVAAAAVIYGTLGALGQLD